MSVLHEPIPTPYFNAACDHDCSDGFTIVASNVVCSECASNLISDNGTASTQLSTDVEGRNNVKNAKPQFQWVSSYHNTHYLEEENPPTKLRLSGSKE